MVKELTKKIISEYLKQFKSDYFWAMIIANFFFYYNLHLSGSEFIIYQLFVLGTTLVYSYTQINTEEIKMRYYENAED